MRIKVNPKIKGSFKFRVDCLDYDMKWHKVYIYQEGETRTKALDSAMLRVGNTPEFEKYAQVEMYNVSIIDNI